MRRRLALTAVLAAGLAAGVLVGTSGTALAFPHVCSGTACHGSGTDSFGDVCAPGTTTYWEDSYLPMRAQYPRLTSFRVTPSPPCAGATVGSPKADPWPAPAADPDGKPAQPKQGEATFRIRWTVTVPQGAKPVGPMDVAWSVAWIDPAGQRGSTATTRTTTTRGPDRYDLEVSAVAQSGLVSAKAPQRVPVEIVVRNNGPATSPPAEVAFQVWLEAKSFGYALQVVDPSGCETQPLVMCPIRTLQPGGEQTLTLTMIWRRADRLARAKELAAGRKVSVEASAHVYVRRVSCLDEETSCANNEASDVIAVH